MRILLVEDDVRMRELVRRGLSETGYRVDSAADASEALALTRDHKYDVMVFDVLLPGPSGIDLVRMLRAAGTRTPVLILTALDAAADIVAGLDAGADDYLTKPFAFKVLLARLRALGRRNPASRDVSLHVADLSLDGATHQVSRGGVAVHLTRTEYSLLESLMRHAGRVVTRDRLVDALWGPEDDVNPNRLDAFVKSLRQKLDVDDRPRLIHTIRGIGYCLREEAEG
ncbi:MAG: response regulator transcription factor [Acidobacteria bacterium]|nr:response regulator transcription factor [Acidobacteriota bacterium]